MNNWLIGTAGAGDPSTGAAQFCDAVDDGLLRAEHGLLRRQDPALGSQQIRARQRQDRQFDEERR